MNTNARPSGPAILPLVLIAIVAALGGGYVGQMLIKSPADTTSDASEQVAATETTAPADDSGESAPAELPVVPEGDSDGIRLPDSQQKAADIQVRPVVAASFTEHTRLTGKVSLNEDRIAHLFPMVEGSVDSVEVGLGQTVKANDLLVVVHSREIGQAKLELYQARLQQELAETQEQLQQEIATNVRQLLISLKQQAPIDQIESQFRSRTMGDFRERLLLAYSGYLKSAADLERLEGPAESGAISGKQLLAARSSRDADQAAFQARIEQVEFELKTGLLQTSQAMKEAKTRVAVAATNLRILGCEEADIDTVDPNQQRASISHYSIRAPFDGTVVSKDVTVKEHIRPDSQIMSVADLSTVWINADIYEQNIPMLSTLSGKTVKVYNEAWPNRAFEATIFFTGEIMDPTTRTISLRAVADNSDHLLKPGMFVNIELSGDTQRPQLQIPLSAVQENAGQYFVFVQAGKDLFARRDIEIGKRDHNMATVISGLTEGENVVVQGGFILKSKLLEDLMGEE